MFTGEVGISRTGGTSTIDVLFGPAISRLLQNLSQISPSCEPVSPVASAVLRQQHIDGEICAVSWFEHQLNESAGIGSHRRFPELHRVHLAQSFESLDIDLSLDLFRLDASEDSVPLRVVQRVVDIL